MTATAVHDQPMRSDLPVPHVPTDEAGRPISADSPMLYEAWQKHIIEGFTNNSTMFRRVLNAFLYPYWLTVILYVTLVLVGIGLFVLGVWLAMQDGKEMFGVISGGLGVGALLAFFVARPLQALEENLQFITWLGIIYNTYWSQLFCANDSATVQQDLKDITQDTIARIKELQEKHTALSGARPKATETSKGQ